jgi:arsenite-transporting ATPase
VDGAAGLDALQMDAATLRGEFLGKWRDVIIAIVDRGTYLDREDIDGLVDAAFPGADEAFAVLRLAAIARAPEYARIIVDTAPTGHTLRLLALPRTFEGVIALLEAMQSKHRFMVRALTQRYRADGADAFLDEMRSRSGRFAMRLAILRVPRQQRSSGTSQWCAPRPSD